MTSSNAPIANSLSNNHNLGQNVTVTLSNALVRLLSEQLYQSPLKAIEELVVNAYDADANECRIFVPLPSDAEHEFIAVYDDGHGMDHEGLADLWQVGRSNKRSEEVERRSKRKQIGKFGIGKLATYTIANQLTYISKTNEGILGVTIDFTVFKDGPEEQTSDNAQNDNVDQTSNQTADIKPINLPVYKIEDWYAFVTNANLRVVLEELGLETIELPAESWTLAILENLKEKAQNINRGSLGWVLSTAMPLSTDFQVFLNQNEITSSKEDYEKIVEFNITELPEKRLEGLSKDTGEDWHVDGEYLISESFPSGIKGNAFVTRRSLYGQKSDDIQRSHGFFVRVRDRLVDLVDPLFGMKPVRYGTLNRFHADIRADDLDEYLTASRDTVEESDIKVRFRKLLREIINEADARYMAKQKEEEHDKSGHKEGEKDLVAPRLVEQPVADALLTHRYDARGAEANEDWFYISLPEGTDAAQLVQQLYTAPRSKYNYQYTAQGIDRLVKFDPVESVFWINTEHELVTEYVGDDGSRRLLEDFVTAEMLLEVYLRENHIDVELIGEILQRRDDLFRSFASDRSYSFETIAQHIREAAADEHELEINLVVAARALGFTANQISGPDAPDGVARYTGYPGGMQKITLEAKSSKKRRKRPKEIDFAALRRHADDNDADGCLLVAPGYVGEDKEDSAVARNAREQRISAWTVEQLARVVEAAESRHIGARDILKIVTSKYAPVEVEQTIEDLLSEPVWSRRDLYHAIIEVLRNMDGSATDEPRNVSMIAGAIITKEPKFKGIEIDAIRKAFTELAGASKGALILEEKGDIFHTTTDLDELERRVADLTKSPTNDRRISSFRDSCTT